jgi:hypothetical protein
MNRGRRGEDIFQVRHAHIRPTMKLFTIVHNQKKIHTMVSGLPDQAKYEKL